MASVNGWQRKKAKKQSPGITEEKVGEWWHLPDGGYQVAKWQDREKPLPPRPVFLMTYGNKTKQKIQVGSVLKNL